MNSIENSSNVYFKNYFSYAALAEDNALLSKLICCYRRLFREDDSWGEDYSKEEVDKKLQAELSGNCVLRLCLTQNDVIGFCWVQHLEPAAIYHHICTIKYVQDYNIGALNLQNALKNKINHSATYIHDLGIAKAYRKKIALDQLIIPTVQHCFKLTNSRVLAFWSVQETCISHLAKKIHLTPFLQFKNMVFFCDDVGEYFP